MSATVYLETSIFGYLASRPNRDLITAANQQLTRDWWDEHREQYDLYVSETVVAECSVGDLQAAQERLEAIGDIPILNVTEDAENLANELVKQVPLPENAEVDALHIATAPVNGINFLLTWNCAHIANAALQPQIEAICRSAGFEPPTICTQQQLMED
ncbi:MAG: type II toxin-antitoxin system VapC family toxin [Planctomycetota bacterium]|nr:type II toxin-antitoxin system VapC family toxin [Planctomycetota bacterium]